MTVVVELTLELPIPILPDPPEPVPVTRGSCFVELDQSAPDLLAESSLTS